MNESGNTAKEGEPTSIHAVGTIFINKKEEILLLLREKSIREGGLWGLVGGEINEGEDNLDAAVRKIKEEIGLYVIPSELKFLKTYRYLWKTGNKDIVFEAFKIDKNEDVKINLIADEHTEYMWAQPEKAYERDDLMVGLYKILADRYDFNEK